MNFDARQTIEMDSNSKRLKVNCPILKVASPKLATKRPVEEDFQNSELPRHKSLKELLSSTPSYLLVSNQEEPNWTAFEQEIMDLAYRHKLTPTINVSKKLQGGYQYHFIFGGCIVQKESLSDCAKPLTTQEKLMCHYKINPCAIGQTFLGDDGKTYRFDGIQIKNTLPQPQFIATLLE